MKTLVRVIVAWTAASALLVLGWSWLKRKERDEY